MRHKDMARRRARKNAPEGARKEDVVGKDINTDDVKCFIIRCYIGKGGELLDLTIESVKPLLYHRSDEEKAFVSVIVKCWVALERPEQLVSFHNRF